MNILLATHNFFPYHSGGTEIYVLNLAKLLIKKGHKITIIAAFGSKTISDQELFYKDNHLKICRYLYDDLTVFGVAYNKTTTEQIYAKKSLPHQKSYEVFFKNMHYDLLHLNGFTVAIGLDLIYALKIKSPNLKIVTSFHTVISDLKETLTFANTLTEQKVRVNTVADVLSYRFNIPYSITKLLSKLLPSGYFQSLPAIFGIKYLLNQHINSFNLLKKETDEWWVYSENLKKHLTDQGIAGGTIKFERHGISSLFIGNRNSARKPIKFLFNGRTVKVKGFHTLLKAWLGSPDREDSQLLVTGEPISNDRSINLLINKSKKRKDIKWLGLLNQEELAKIYQQVHTVIIPSECYETGPLVFYEAIASGCDVIASDIGGCKELTQLYHNLAIGFKTGDSDDLNIKINSATKNPHALNNQHHVLSFHEHFASLFNQSSFYD